jgi:hypothetical protein
MAGINSQSIAQTVGQVAGGIRGNTALENKWIASAPPEMQEQMRAQLEMQKMQELVQLITQMMKQMHEMSMSVIRNVGG